MGRERLIRAAEREDALRHLGRVPREHQPWTVETCRHRGDATEEWLAAADEPQVRSLLGTLVQSSPLGIALLDGDLRFVVVNEALAECNGVPVSEHIGRSLSEVVPDIAADAARAFERVLATGEPLVGLDWRARPLRSREWSATGPRACTGSGWVTGPSAWPPS